MGYRIPVDSSFFEKGVPIMDSRPVEVFVQFGDLTEKFLALSDEKISAAEPTHLLDEERDIYLGKANPLLRRLYTLLVITRSSQPYLPMDFFIGDYSEEERDKICREICLSAVELEMLECLFSAEVVRIFPDFHSAGLLKKLDMRKGWIVTAPKPAPFPCRKSDPRPRASCDQKSMRIRIPKASED